MKRPLVLYISDLAFEQAEAIDLIRGLRSAGYEVMVTPALETAERAEPFSVPVPMVFPEPSKGEKPNPNSKRSRWKRGGKLWRF